MFFPCKQHKTKLLIFIYNDQLKATSFGSLKKLFAFILFGQFSSEKIVGNDKL